MHFNKFLGSAAAAAAIDLGTTLRKLLLWLLGDLGWAIQQELKEPHLTVRSVICLLRPKERLYIVEIYFSIQPKQRRLLLEQESNTQLKVNCMGVRIREAMRGSWRVLF